MKTEFFRFADGEDGVAIDATIVETGEQGDAWSFKAKVKGLDAPVYGYQAKSIGAVKEGPARLVVRKSVHVEFPNKRWSIAREMASDFDFFADFAMED